MMSEPMLTSGGPEGHEHRPYVAERSHRHAPGKPEHWHDEDGWSTLPVEEWD